MFRRVPTNYFKNLTVWGSGIMGSGIAQVGAQAGVSVTMLVSSQARADSSRKSIESALSRVAKKKYEGDEAKIKQHIDNIMKHITWTTDEAAATSNADIIIEATKENRELKMDLFARIDKLAPKNTVFCTNTSSLSVGELAAATSRPERFLGTHFFSPVPMMKLVEIVTTEKADPACADKVTEFAKKIGKIPVRATDTAGFIVNRLLVPYLFEAYRLKERGAASMEDIDTAMKLGCGYPMGPFELSDAVGLDVLKSINDVWHAQFPNDPLFAPCKLLHDTVAAGKHGKKTGEGFFKYDDKGRRAA